MDAVNLNLPEKVLTGTIDCMPFQENVSVQMTIRIDQVYEELGWLHVLPMDICAVA